MRSWLIPNRDNPAIDYVQSYYVKDYSPVRVVVLMAKSLDEVVEQLQNGTARTQAYFCDTLFCYEPKWGQFAGVLCRANEFNISDRCAKLSETVYSLPSYTISSGDMLLALNPLFDSYLPKLENFSKAVPVTVLATGV